MKQILGMVIFSAIFASSAFAGSEWQVIGNNVNFRSSANFRGQDNIIKQLDEGQKMTVTNETDKYVEAVLSPTGEKGFIWKKYVEMATTHEFTPPPVDAGVELPSTNLSPPMCGCSTCRVTDKYGMRTHPITGNRKMHTGCDIGTRGAAPKVYAVADGIVTFAGTNGGYGKTIDIQHQSKITTPSGKSYDSGVTSRYAHLKSIAPGISKNARVKKGQYIGVVNSTGLSNGNHLHIELSIKGGQTIDPEGFFSVADTTKECGSDGAPVGSRATER